MLNMIRADCYRLLRSKVVSITLGIYFLFIVFLTLVVLDSGYEALTSVAPLAESVLLFMLPVMFAVAAADFQYRTIKNTIAGGASRLKIYASKWIVAILFGIILYLGTFVLLTLTGTAFYGFGKEITGELMIAALQVVAVQMVFVIGAVSMGISLIFISKSALAFCSIYLILFYMTDFILSMASAYFKNPDIQIPSFLSNMRMIGLESFTSISAIQALSVAVAYMVFSTVPSIWLFRRSEIK